MASLRGFASFIKQQIYNRPTTDSVGGLASSRLPKDSLPEMVSPLVATTTRSPTIAEIKYLASQQLHIVSYDPTFWDRLFKALDENRAWKAASEQKLKDPSVRAWAHAIDPHSTHRSLGTTLYSEEDAADHSVARFLHPATRIIQAMADYEGVGKASHPIMSITSISATKSQSTPDRVLRLLELFQAINEIKAIIEFKTPNSLKEKDWDPLFQCFQDLQQEFGQIFPIPYWWMADQDSLEDKLDKILCQLWCEMQSFDVSYGFLSSFLSNMVVRRERLHGYNCLYFSNFVSAQKLTLKHIVAVEAAALGWITVPPPPELSMEAKNLLATYTDEDLLRRLLQGSENPYGWDARFANMQRVRHALTLCAAAGNPVPPIDDTETQNTPRRGRPRPVEEDDDETPRASRARIAQQGKVRKFVV